MSGEDLLRGLPLLGASPLADLFGHGPVVGDDGLGLLGGDGGAVGVAEDIGRASVHDGPGPLGQVGGDHAGRAEVVFAALDHLGVVDAGQLGVLAAGVVGGADQGGAQQLVAGLGDGLAFAVAVAVAVALRDGRAGDSSLGGAVRSPSALARSAAGGGNAPGQRGRAACAARAHRRAAAGGRWNALNASRRDDQRSLRRTLFHACCAISQTVNRSSRSMPSSRTMRPNFWPAEVCWSRARRMSRFDAS